MFRNKKIILVLVLLIALTFSTSCSFSEEGRAINFVKERVVDYLKSPSSAEFPANDEFDVTKSTDDVFHITGYVDSQNSFGAMVRVYYRVEVKHISNMYILQDIEFLE